MTALNNVEEKVVVIHRGRCNNKVYYSFKQLPKNSNKHNFTRFNLFKVWALRVYLLDAEAVNRSHMLLVCAV